MRTLVIITRVSGYLLAIESRSTSRVLSEEELATRVGDEWGSRARGEDEGEGEGEDEVFEWDGQIVRSLRVVAASDI